MTKLKLLAEWFFDQFIYPLWQAVFGRNTDDSETDDQP
jgi:hypothetical protein